MRLRAGVSSFFADLDRASKNAMPAFMSPKSAQLPILVPISLADIGRRSGRDPEYA